MNLIDCLDVFVQVGKSLNFSKAAASLGVSNSSVTKKIAWLEAHFEVQLLNRNTKHVSLTESGRLLLENADMLAQSVRGLKELVQGPVRTASGRIRLGTPPFFGAVHLVPAIEDFLRRHPSIKVSLLLDDGRSDLIAENLDLSVRIAPRLKDTNQIAYRITVVPQVLVATKAYLLAHGEPRIPRDLERHNCLVHNLKAPTSHWTLTDKQRGTHLVRVNGNFSSNLGESIQNLVKLDHGISMHPRYMVENDIADGSLQVVLPDYEAEGLDIHAIVQTRRNLPNKVRLFVEHLRAWFRDADWKR
ncbi:LysR family transcriptional regulator [Bordetella sp. N]|uniref:LysR family transcriptional regulator n=1 Tax=Bordetella sp. N TaxID=1746199 RepID=UPI00070FED2D|nr:LysR family transcriptional regulator [Bordetella sp. N]ALM84309.1 transcriptional regulator [Bordetella sp. N]